MDAGDMQRPWGAAVTLGLSLEHRVLGREKRDNSCWTNFQCKKPL